MLAERQRPSDRRRHLRVQQRSTAAATPLGASTLVRRRFTARQQGSLRYVRKVRDEKVADSNPVTPTSLPWINRLDVSAHHSSTSAILCACSTFSAPPRVELTLASSECHDNFNKAAAAGHAISAASACPRTFRWFQSLEKFSRRSTYLARAPPSVRQLATMAHTRACSVS